MHSEQHPYNIGIMSALPFTVIHEYRPPLFERGVLHVLFTTIDVHVMVAHLDAHDSLKRENETAFLAAVVSPLLLQGNAKPFIIFMMSIMHSVWQ
jgi:endonuclease/exonuclease/phosphatase family metal-dependent hydrolase